MRVYRRLCAPLSSDSAPTSTSPSRSSRSTATYEGPATSNSHTLSFKRQLAVCGHRIHAYMVR
eukprot:2340828-Rhodomonas_salina.1